MYKTIKGSLTLMILFVMCPLFPQGILDSVFNIKEVIKTGTPIFKKENAGMKETDVDTLVLIEKVNLTLSELLSENTPVFIKSNGRGALATASFRGTAASHTQVSWNGININTPMAGMVDFSLIPVYIIDDLKLKHGSASIADKSGGLGGSINIGNQVDWNSRFNAKVMQGIGSYSTYDEFCQLGGGNKKLQLKTRLYYNYSKNDYTFINHSIGNIDSETGEITNPLDTNNNAEYTRYGMLQEAYYRINNNNIFSAKYWGQYADRTIPRATSYEGPENSNLNNQIDADNKAVVDWKHYGNNSKFIVRSGYSGKHLDYTLKNYVSGEGLIPAIYSVSTQHSFFNTFSYTKETKKDFSFSTSLDANYHRVISKDTVAETGYTKNRKELSALIGMQKTFYQCINLNLLIRQDYVDDSLSPIVPYLGFDYRIFKGKDLLFKGNIARNYHQPTLNDLYWQPGGNEDLQSEKGISYEVGLEYQLKTKNHYYLKTELTAYHSDIDNWIIWIPSYKGYWQPLNIKHVISQGVELNLTTSGKIKALEYKISGTCAYTSSKNYGDVSVWGDESYGKQLVYVPLRSANLMINLNYKSFFATYQFNHYSERYTTSSNNTTKRDWLYPYYMSDLNIGKEFTLKTISLTTEFKTYNLLNETYHSVLYRPMPKRNYILLIMIKF